MQCKVKGNLIITVHLGFTTPIVLPRVFALRSMSRKGPDGSSLVPEKHLSRLCAVHQRHLEPALCLRGANATCNFRGVWCRGVCHCQPGFLLICPARHAPARLTRVTCRPYSVAKRSANDLVAMKQRFLCTKSRQGFHRSAPDQNVTTGVCARKQACSQIKSVLCFQGILAKM